MSGTNVSTVSVGPTAENLAALRYGEAVPFSSSRHLEPRQFRAFRPKIAAASDDNGWIGPLGITTMHSTAGSLYGYGVPSDSPQY